MRVFFGDNGTLIDYSVELSKYRSGTQAFTMVAAEDFIYIAQDAPFNHAYLKLSVLNTNSSNVSVDYWNGREWIAAVEVRDETDGLQQSGFITWTPDKDERWERESTNYKSDSIIGLEDVVIYDKYWARIKVDADLTAVTADWIGNLFSDDEDLGSEFPDLVRANMKAAFETGKTEWQEQHVKASELIIHDLVAKNVIDNNGQILDRSQFTLASVSKVSEIVYGALGDDYTDQKLESRKEYFARLDKGIYKVDKDNDAILDTDEKFRRTGFFSR